jgi:AcrR family transcriptional regulator
MKRTNPPLPPLPDNLVAYDLPEPETDRGRATRDRLLDAAELVFFDAGYDQATITAITHGAGVAQGSFYTYFPSKHAAFVELIQRFARDLRRTVAIASSRGAQTRAGVERAALEAYFTYLCQHPALYTMVHESRVIAPELHRWWVEFFTSGYIGNFDRLTPDRPTDVDTEMLAYALAGIADMLALRWVIWRKEVPPAAVLDQLFDFLSTGLDGMLRPDHVQVGTAGVGGSAVVGRSAR